MQKYDRKIWLNEKILSVQEATINVLSPTAQFGANVFEGIRCYWSASTQSLAAFKLEEHFDRLERSLKMFRIKCPYPRQDWLPYIRDIVQANNYREDIAIRQTVFVDGDSGSWFSTEPVGMFIAPISRPRKAVPLTTGISCCISSWERISERTISPKIKVGANYINSRMAQIEATTNGYDSALFMNREGTVAEGPGSCFFMVRNGVLITPPLSASVLESITREVLLELGRMQGISVVERAIDRTELYICDEAFLCGSAAELTPILSVDGYTVGSGAPGPLTTALHEQYLRAAEGKLPGCETWVTSLH
ncbi:branched-chain amino acid transaminase [Desulfovibrio sp.]|uniref:branched-chain amino acid transaminase n=1 Tax=Desulfovibrio sp. TaxID=885 RepID=UPI0025C1D444|nr:branched-chain amino acid transaminase [Desulfovibrio sp.]